MNRKYPAPRVVRVKGSPSEMGRQHGRQLSDLLRSYKRSIESFNERIGLTKERLAEIVALNEEELELNTPELIDELRGIGEGAKMPYGDVLSMYLCPEIISPLAVVHRGYYMEHLQECTAFAALNEATVDRLPLLAQTRDDSPEGVQFRIVVIATPRDGNSYVAHSRPTVNGGYGVNSKGVTIAAPTVHVLDSVNAINSGRPSGTTDCTLTKLVMEKCGSVDEAMKYVDSKPGGYKALNVLVVDEKGGIAKVERSYTSVKRISEDASCPMNSVMAATNHFVSRKTRNLGPSGEKEYASSCRRYERIMELLTSEARRISLNKFKSFARDHVNGPSDLSICRHGEDTCTNSAFIAEPAKRRLHVLTGTPCQNSFVTHECPG
jgi:predicted choloylglycine hydrolase